MAILPPRAESPKFSTTILPFLSSLSSTTLRSNMTGEESKQKELEEFYATYNVWTGIRTAATLSLFFLFTVTVIIYKSKCKRHRKYELYPSLEDLPGRPLDYYDYWPTPIGGGDNISNHSRKSDDKDFFCRIFDDETGSAPLPTFLLGNASPSLRNSFRVKSLPGSVMRINLSRMNSLEKEDATHFVTPSCYSTPRNKHPSDEPSQNLIHVVENSLHLTYLLNQESSTSFESKNAESSCSIRNSSPSMDSCYEDSLRSEKDVDTFQNPRKFSTFGSPRDLISSTDLLRYKGLRKVDTFSSPRDFDHPTRVPNMCDSETNTDLDFSLPKTHKRMERNLLSIPKIPNRRYSVDTERQITPRKLEISGSLKLRSKADAPPEKRISLKDLENYRISSDLLSVRSKVKVHSFGSPKDLDSLKISKDKSRTVSDSEIKGFLRKPSSFQSARNVDTRRVSRNLGDSRNKLTRRSFVNRSDLAALRKSSINVDNLHSVQVLKQNEVGRIPNSLQSPRSLVQSPRSLVQSPRSPKSIDSFRSVSYSDQLWRSSKHDSIKRPKLPKTNTFLQSLTPEEGDLSQEENIMEIPLK